MAAAQGQAEEERRTTTGIMMTDMGHQVVDGLTPRWGSIGCMRGRL